MPDPDPRDEASEPLELSDEEIAYEPPPELIDERNQPPSGRPGRSAALKLAGAAAIVLVVAGGLLAYRAQHRRKVVSEGLANAEALLRSDTAAGFRRAASLLEPIAQLDPLEAGSLRAFALAMLVADYRASGPGREIDDLLVAPGRAEVVPAHAQLAIAALALARREVGTATAALSRAGDGPWASALQARVALAAGNPQAALSPAAAAAAEAAFPAGLAIHGDALRRLRTDPAAARAAYEAALAASPLHPRSAYGLAKLALAGQAPADEAERALERILEDGAGTPASERARAALHLASLRTRAGDRAGAAAALDRVALDPAARAWAAGAAAVAAEQRGPYRAVLGAPPALRSASDDDPGELSPQPPAPPAAPATKAVAKAEAKAKTVSAKKGVAKKSPVAKPKPYRKGSAGKRSAAKSSAAKRAASKASAAKSRAAKTPTKSAKAAAAKKRAKRAAPHKAPASAP